MILIFSFVENTLKYNNLLVYLCCYSKIKKLGVEGGLGCCKTLPWPYTVSFIHLYVFSTKPIMQLC